MNEHWADELSELKREWADTNTDEATQVEDLADLLHSCRQRGIAVDVEDVCHCLPHLQPRVQQALAQLERLTPLLGVGHAADANDRFPGYAVERTGGAGGMGVVYVGQDQRLGRRVALKTPAAVDDATTRRFEREAAIAARLEHPGIVPVYHSGKDRFGNPFFAMRFIDQETLEEKISRFHEAQRPMHRADAEFVDLIEHMIAVSRSTHYAHDQGALHLDIKPANIAVSRYGETILLDWGLSVRVSDDSESTAAPKDEPAAAMTSVGGTLAYCSPEQRRGDFDAIAPATDIYLLGATLHHILYGRPPHAGADGAPSEAGDGGLRSTDSFAGAPTPDAESPVATGRAPAPLAAMCRQAMAENPSDRYPTADAFARDLQNWTVRERVEAWDEPWTVRLERWGRKHRTWVIASGGVLLTALVVASAASLLLASKNEELVRQIAAKEKARQEAAEARDQARLAVDTYLFEAGRDPRLSRNHLEDLRLQLFVAAEPFYEKLIRTNSLTAEEEYVRPAAMVKLGLIQRERGDFSLAQQTLSSAIATLEELADDDAAPAAAHVELLEGRVALGSLMAETVQQRDAAQILEAAVDVDEMRLIDAPFGRQLLTDGLLALGDVHADAARIRPAEQAYRRALASAAQEPPDTVHATLSRMQALAGLHQLGFEQPDQEPGDDVKGLVELALRAIGDVEARDAIGSVFDVFQNAFLGLDIADPRMIHDATKMIAAFELLSLRFPGILVYEYAQAVGHRVLAEAMMEQERYAAARLHLEKANAILQQALDQSPADQSLVEELAGTRYLIGDNLAQTGHVELAIKWYDDAIASSEKLLELNRVTSKFARRSEMS